LPEGAQALRQRGLATSFNGYRTLRRGQIGDIERDRTFYLGNAAVQSHHSMGRFGFSYRTQS